MPFVWLFLLHAAFAQSVKTIQIEDVFYAVSPAPQTHFLKANSYAPLKPQGATLLNLEPWTDGVLPLVFTSDISPQEQQILFEVCKRWSEVARVKCVRGPYKNKKLTVGRWFDACWSLWGMGTHFLMLKRRMNLASSCFDQWTLLHELGHAFGLIHEHQRPDRDLYVTLHLENADKGLLSTDKIVNYDKQGAVIHTPYDFYSIMHYQRNFGSINQLDTIVPTAPFAQYINIMGQNSKISDGDKLALQAIYGKP